MSKFILVHEVPTGNPVVIHSEEIKIVKKSNDFGGSTAIHSYVYEDTLVNPFIHVTETPEKIFEMLK